MSSVDFVEYPLYDAEVLRNKGLMVTEDPELDLAIVRYHKSDNEWYNKQYGECDRSDPIVRFHRSVIYSLSTKCVIHASPQRRKSDTEIILSSLRKENWVVTPYIDGTMISVFWHSSKDCWILSTRSKFHAACKFMSPQPFRDLFNEGIRHTYDNKIESIEDFLKKLDDVSRDYSYTFILCHPENKHVMIVNEPKVYLVQVSHCRPFTTASDQTATRWKPLGYSEMARIATEINIPYPEEMLVPEDQALSDYCRDVISKKEPYGVMLTQSARNPCVERIRVLSNGYDKASVLRGNTPSSRTNIIRIWSEDPAGDLLREYEEYFPSESEEVHSVIRTLYESANELDLYYKNRHVRKSMEHGDLPHWVRKPIWDLHGVYLREHEPIKKDTILEYYRNKPAAFVNKVLKMREKEIQREQSRVAVETNSVQPSTTDE